MFYAIRKSCMKLLMPSLALYKPKKSLEIKSKSQRSSVGCVNTYRLITDFYSYDAIARPTTRNINERSDTFAYNTKSELTTAQLGSDNYAYGYDNIGNRKTAQELAEEITYDANSTNEYTAIGDFTPEFDLDGNQTKLQTATGIWTVVYNAENRPISFTSEDGNTIVEARYDHMGRRAWKKITVNGATTLYEAYIYRGYLQIACEGLKGGQGAQRFITWDPTQPEATRPLAIEQMGTWYTYGLDLSKNVTELYTNTGSLATKYDYSPFGAVTQTGEVSSPVQWSSEYHDQELALVYYNYRHYNPQDGRWINRDPIGIEGGLNLYGFVGNRGNNSDELGLTLNMGNPENRPMQAIFANLGVLAYTGDPNIGGAAYPTIEGEDEFETKTINKQCCVRVKKAKKLVVNVVTYLPSDWYNPILVERGQDTSGDIYHSFNTSGYNAMIGHENRRRQVYLLANTYFLQPAELEGTQVTKCDWVCDTSTEKAKLRLISFLDDLRDEAIDKYTQYINREQDKIGIESQKPAGFVTYNADKSRHLTQSGYRYLHTVSHPKNIIWRSNCR